ncbi:MAG: DNA-processing protein DprA [Patescibacteria group bacterium]|jgi:DNA processing protein|nr:DNA-processing protein DprA [Patescibacteria group bacterium]
MQNLKEKIYFNALNLASACNYNLLSKLKNFYKSFEKIWFVDDYNDFLNYYPKFSLETIQNFYQNKQKINPQKEWEKLEDGEYKLILLEEKEYPSLLKEIAEPPLGIYIFGEFDFNNKPIIAIVGTRKATNYGKMVAEKITKELVECGFITVSGLAYGIDTICHQTTLENKGQTIAVLGSGLDIIFPSANRKLSERIVKSGALISEYPLSTPPLKHHFPARNRIISGLALGTIVIEAPLKSGSLITARFALEQNREVFAVPGSIFSQNYEGNHQLIKSGAKLVHNIGDILDELNIAKNLTLNIDFEKTKTLFNNLTVEEKKILDIIKKSESPLSIDDIIKISEFDTGVVNQIITLLELKNLIKWDMGGYQVKF